MLKTHDILIVLINYHNDLEIMNYIKQVDKIKGETDVRVLIVDNGCEECKFCEELKEYEFAELICSGKNLGYMNGFLYGLDYFNEKYKYLPYWTVLSNSDIIFEQQDFFKILSQKEYDDKIWCVGPSVKDLNGNFCNPHYRERIPVKKINRIRFFMNNALLSKFYFFMSSKKRKSKNQVKANSCFSYSVHGCFMIMRNDFYFALSGEKYGAFLYSEESFVAEVILAHGKKVYYDSDIEVLHTENVATGKLGTAKKGKAIAKSLKYIKERFYDPQ